MIRIDQNLNPKIFDTDVEQAPTRKGFGEGLLMAGELDEQVVGLCADLTESTQMHLFAKKFPKRFIQVGVAEQNLPTVASGLAAMGKIPFTSSYAMFSPGRNWEQIRTTCTYNDRPVKIVGSHAGVSVGPDGGTHQAIEDIALMRVLPRMIVVAPCDSIEAKKATLAIAKNGRPSYLRLAREKTAVFTTDKTPFEIGRAEIFWDSIQESKINPPVELSTHNHNSVALIACGPLVHQAMIAAKELTEEGVGVVVVNNHTIKPMDSKTIIEVAKRVSAVVTIEEHQKAGGMGSAVSEILSEHYPIKISFIGVDDQYGQSGEQVELLRHYKLDAHSIIEKVKEILK